MIKRKHLAVGFLAFCLFIPLFIGVTTTDWTPPPHEYDPWVDFNDDGRISWQELFEVVGRYGTEGTPINKTALLLELQRGIYLLNVSIGELGLRMDAAEADILTNAEDIATNAASIAENAADIDTLQSKMVSMEADISTNTADIATNADNVANLEFEVDSLNSSLAGLQTRIEALEANCAGARTIRFVEPAESDVATSMETVALFHWYPENVTSNALLSVTLYSEYRSNFSDADLNFRITISDAEGHYQAFSKGALTPAPSNWSWTWTWSVHPNPINALERWNPNQLNYTIKIAAFSQPPGYRVYIRNVNVIITVVDGMPASNE